MEKVKQLPIRVGLGLLEEELKSLLKHQNYQISAVRKDSDGDFVCIEIYKIENK
jgi:hypothetical protein